LIEPRQLSGRWHADLATPDDSNTGITGQVIPVTGGG
jgi:hypothetical protein